MSEFCDCGDYPNGPLRRAADCPTHRITDAQRLAWYESKHTLHNDLELLYVVGGFEMSVMEQDGQHCKAVYSGKTLAECIDRAMAAEVCVGWLP